MDLTPEQQQLLTECKKVLGKITNIGFADLFGGLYSAHLIYEQEPQLLVFRRPSMSIILRLKGNDLVRAWREEEKDDAKTYSFREWELEDIVETILTPDGVTMLLLEMQRYDLSAELANQAWPGYDRGVPIQMSLRLILHFFRGGAPWSGDSEVVPFHRLRKV